MGGPTASILLREALTEPQQRAVEHQLSQLGTWEATPHTLHVHTTHPIGGTYTSPFGRSLDVEFIKPTIEALQPEQFVMGFGFWPQQEIQLNACANRPDDHRILGHLALTLAERFNGVIDFGGMLLPRLSPEVQHQYHDAHISWETLAEHSRTFLQHIPGTIIEVLYETTSERMWMYHMADSTFLRAWLMHPEFHMIK